MAVELGGKNPHIVFADAEWDSAVDHVLTGVFLHSGQVCSAGTRLIVEESIADDFVADLAGRAEKIRMGDGMDPASETGPLVSEQQRAKVEAHVQQGISEGAKLVTGGARPSDPALDKGSFYLPTIFDRCDRSMRIVQEETFGPILTVERFTDRGRGDRTRQRHGIRSRGGRSDVRPGAGRTCGAGTAARHGVAERLRLLHRGGGVGRIRQVGQRSRARTNRARGIPRAQAHLAQHRADDPPAGSRAVRTNLVMVDQGAARRQRHWRTSATSESLDRSIGKFASFAAGVSYISILTGTFQLFYFGFGTAGPAYLWSWPMVFVGQMAVALCFMELAAKYPVAGSVYNWSKKLGSRLVGWSSGWLMLTASIVTISAVVLAYQLNLPRIWSGFQIVGDGTGEYDFATNAVILGTVLIAFTTLVNALGVKLMARINSAGVFIELIAAVLIAIILALNVKRGPDIFFSTNGYGAGESYGYLGAFLIASLASAVRDVRLRHRELARRGDGRPAPHGTEGHLHGRSSRRSSSAARSWCSR